jgi:hypothetical protein
VSVRWMNLKGIAYGSGLSEHGSLRQDGLLAR